MFLQKVIISHLYVNSEVPGKMIDHGINSINQWRRFANFNSLKFRRNNINLTHATFLKSQLNLSALISKRILRWNFANMLHCYGDKLHTKATFLVSITEFEPHMRRTSPKSETLTEIFREINQAYTKNFCIIFDFLSSIGN